MAPFLSELFSKLRTKKKRNPRKLKSTHQVLGSIWEFSGNFSLQSSERIGYSNFQVFRVWDHLKMAPLEIELFSKLFIKKKPDENWISLRSHRIVFLEFSASFFKCNLELKWMLKLWSGVATSARFKTILFNQERFWNHGGEEHSRTTSIHRNFHSHPPSSHFTILLWNKIYLAPVGGRNSCSNIEYSSLSDNIILACLKAKLCIWKLIDIQSTSSDGTDIFFARPGPILRLPHRVPSRAPVTIYSDK